MKILVGTDFTEQAAEAANAAAALAAGWGEPLMLAYVMDRKGLDDLSPKVLAEIDKTAERSLKTEAKRLQALGATVQGELLHGPPYESLSKRADPNSIRLLVVSSRGRKAPVRWLLGSVSERVAESSPVPTLVVRNADPFIDWIQGVRPLRIMVASDMSPTADAALAFVRSLQKIGPCEITVSYVDSPLEERTRLGLKGPASLTVNDPEVERVLQRDLRRRTQEVLGHGQFEVLVEPNLGRPDFALAQTAQKHTADVIITGTHQRHGAHRLWHMSFSRGVLHTAKTNVLCVPVENISVSSEIHPVSRVLVTTDLSPLGNAAVAQAFGLSRAGGVVHILHVLPTNDLPNPLIGGHLEKKRPTKKEWLRLRKQVEARLAELIPSAAAEHGIESEIELVESRDTAKAICQAAERLGADTICLATHGHTGLTSSLLGSVAQEVVATAKRPVTLVKSLDM